MRTTISSEKTSGSIPWTFETIAYIEFCTYRGISVGIVFFMLRLRHYIYLLSEIDSHFSTVRSNDVAIEVNETKNRMFRVLVLIHHSIFISWFLPFLFVGGNLQIWICWTFESGFSYQVGLTYRVRVVLFTVSVEELTSWTGLFLGTSPIQRSSWLGDSSPSSVQQFS